MLWPLICNLKPGPFDPPETYSVSQQIQDTCCYWEFPPSDMHISQEDSQFRFPLLTGQLSTQQTNEAWGISNNSPVIRSTQYEENLQDKQIHFLLVSSSWFILYSRHLSFLHKALTHCFSLSFVIQDGDMHKYKWFRSNYTLLKLIFTLILALLMGLSPVCSAKSFYCDY